MSRPKRRMSWSLEHVSQLLRSPIYFGTSSLKQRSRKATARKKIIIRDAIYWVPLIMITMGVRPEEIFGHLEGTTVDKHYSDHDLMELKDILDSLDYGIEVGRDRQFGFPIITGITAPPRFLQLSMSNSR